ncbi:hypothetical protein JAAARDRAFT_195356 [Jaapia argillacea MUCL 33604]|uniref:Uncharacterized protein n=1 Tax=Jaapia argillacea MUCL 33604 TaxID=933084 RepID=A0A067PMX6_9AGAM|nr:hypothetical protein JAAARDRAFT_195356 [Jaapia argillacea MUCL 33604]
MYSPHYSRPPSSRTSGQQDPRRRETHQQHTRSPHSPSYQSFPGGFVAIPPIQSNPTPQAIPRSYEVIDYSAPDAYRRSMNTRASNNTHTTPDREYSQRPYEPGQTNPPHPRRHNNNHHEQPAPQTPQNSHRRAYLPSSRQAFDTRHDRYGVPPTEDVNARHNVAQSGHRSSDGASWRPSDSPPERDEFPLHLAWNPPSNYHTSGGRYVDAVEREAARRAGEGSGRMDNGLMRASETLTRTMREDTLGMGASPIVQRRHWFMTFVI